MGCQEKWKAEKPREKKWNIRRPEDCFLAREGLTVKPQAGLEGPGLQRCLEASNPFCLAALGPLAFSNSVALLVKKDANT